MLCDEWIGPAGRGRGCSAIVVAPPVKRLSVSQSLGFHLAMAGNQKGGVVCVSVSVNRNDQNLVPRMDLPAIP